MKNTCQSVCQSVYRVTPVEVRRDDDTHTKDGSCDRLYAGLHADGGDLKDALFNWWANIDVVHHVTWEKQPSNDFSQI